MMIKYALKHHAVYITLSMPVILIFYGRASEDDKEWERVDGAGNNLTQCEHQPIRLQLSLMRRQTSMIIT